MVKNPRSNPLLAWLKYFYTAPRKTSIIRAV